MQWGGDRDRDRDLRGRVRMGALSRNALAVFFLLKTNWGIGMMAMPYLIRCSGLLLGPLLFVFSMALVVDAILRLDAAQRQLRLHRQDWDPLLVNKQPEAIAESKVGALVETQTLCQSPLQNSTGVVSPVVDTESAESLISNTELTDAEIHSKPRKTGGQSKDTYVMLIEKGLGIGAARIATICLVLGFYGSLIAYLKFIQDNFHVYLGIQRWIPCLIIVSILVPMQMIENIKHLAFASLIGLVFGFGFVSILIATAVKAGEASLTDSLHEAPLFRWEKLPIALGIATFSSEGILVVWPPTASAFNSHESSVRQGYRCSGILLVTMVVFTVIYIFVAVLGYLLFTDSVKAELTLSLNTHDISNKIAVVCYCSFLVVSCIVGNYVAHSSYEPALRGCFRTRHPNTESLAGENPERLPIYFVLLRILYPVSAGILSYFLPNFGAFLSLLGALMNSIVMYILPNLLFIQYVKASRCSKIWSWMVVFYAIVSGGVGTYSSMKSLLES